MDTLSVRPVYYYCLRIVVMYTSIFKWYKDIAYK